jgi:hypothetical protein
MAYETLPRLPDPLTSPAGPGFTTIALTDNAPGMLRNLNGGGSISVKYAGNYWTLNISYPQLDYGQEANELIGFLYSLQGTFNNFHIQVPTYNEPGRGTNPWTGALPSVVDVTAGASSNQIDIANWSTLTDDINIGDVFKLSDVAAHKIYMVTGKSLNADVMTLTCNSEVAEDPNLAVSTIDPRDVLFRVRLEGKLPNLQLNSDGLYEGFSLTLRENIL